jgi:preprotein translocase subunit SecD
MNMLTGQNRFNIYLGLLLASVIAGGCQTAARKSKVISALRLHLEVYPDGTDRSQPVPVYRGSPVMINVESTPFLHEAYVSNARLVDADGGFAIQIQFDSHGARLLELYSTAHKGKHFAIFSQFGETADQSRWLAAPLVSRNITDGLFAFTPDATREEAERIVSGLNRVAEQQQP